MGRIYRVSEVAREIGRCEKWLREAERRSMIPLAKRDINSWRVYTEDDIEWLKELLMPSVK